MERVILIKQKQPLLHILSATVVLALYLSNFTVQDTVIFATTTLLVLEALLSITTASFPFLNTQSEIYLKFARVKENSKA